MGSLETFSYKERLNGDFSFYDNCVDEVSINGETEQTGKISYLVDFSCRMLADNNTSDKVEVTQSFEKDQQLCKNIRQSLMDGSEKIVKIKTFCKGDDGNWIEVAPNNESSLDTTKIVPETDEELKNAEVESSSVNSYQVLQKVFYIDEIWRKNNELWRKNNPIGAGCSYENSQVSQRLQEYCEQFDTSLNTYSITHRDKYHRFDLCDPKYPITVNFSCKEPIDEAKWASISNEAVNSFNKSGLPSHCSELYGCASEMETNSSRVNSYKNSTYSNSRLNSSSSGKFANLNPQQRAHCQDKLNRGKIKLDRSSNLYYEMEDLPLQGLQKKYVCNNDGSQGLAMFNAFTGAATGNQNANQNYNQSASPNQPFSLGSPTMKQAIFKLTQAQGYFLEALDEEEHAIAVRQYSMNLNQGTAIGEDDMEKILEKSHEWQSIINKKMKEGFVLDAKAKQTFSQGIPHYASGTALCITGGFSVASQVSNVTNSSGAAAVIGGIGLAFSAYDSVKALNLFFSSTSDIYAFGKENNVENIEELEKAKDSLGT